VRVALAARQGAPPAAAPSQAERAKLLERLFAPVDDEESAMDWSKEEFTKEADAFIGVAARILVILDAAGEGGARREAVVAAASHAEHPDFAEFVNATFAEADQDGDASLSKQEAEDFMEMMKAQAAYMLFGHGRDEFSEAIGNIVGLLEEKADKGITLEQLREVATTEDTSDLVKLVNDLFPEADEDDDGVLNKAEAAKFRELLEEAIFEAEDMEEDSGSEADEDSGKAEIAEVS